MTKRKLNKQEKERFEMAVIAVDRNAQKHREKRPAMSTLIEEMAEAILASRGKHNDTLETEIIQIGGICVNILWQLAMGQEDHICNLGDRTDG